MVQGKVERFGVRDSFRMAEKARRDSTDSPARERSAMTEFHDQTLVVSTYLLKKVARLELLRGKLLIVSSDKAAATIAALVIFIHFPGFGFPCGRFFFYKLR